MRKLRYTLEKTSDVHQRMMEKALRLAKAAGKKGEVPVGAILVREKKIIARGMNLTKSRRDPTAHAEMVTLVKGAKALKNERFLETALYVTLEPCAMCAGAIVQARIPLVVFGARDLKAGACGSVLTVVPNIKLNHRPGLIEGIKSKESSELLKRFFRRRR